MATLPAVKPSAYLSKLLEVLKSSAVCVQGTWELGNSILGVCQTVLRCNTSAGVLQALGDTLLYLWQHYNDVDIRDQARFTYMLLTNVSGNYLRTVLEPTQVTSIDRGTAATLYNDYVPKDGQDAEPRNKQEGVKAASHKLLAIVKAQGSDGLYGSGGGGGGGRLNGGFSFKKILVAGLNSDFFLQMVRVPLIKLFRFPFAPVDGRPAVSGGSSNSLSGTGPAAAGNASAVGGTAAAGIPSGLLQRRSSGSSLAAMRLGIGEVPLDASLYEALKADKSVLHAYIRNLAQSLPEVRSSLLPGLVHSGHVSSIWRSSIVYP